MQEAHGLRQELADAKQSAMQEEQMLHNQARSLRQELEHVRVQNAGLDTRWRLASLLHHRHCLWSCNARLQTLMQTWTESLHTQASTSGGLLLTMLRLHDSLLRLLRNS